MNVPKVIHNVFMFWADKVCRRIENRWNSSGIQGEANTWFTVDTVGSLIVARIMGSGAKAFALEFGTGSKLDKDNPYLSKYINSPYFNKERMQKAYAILGRDKGETVYGLDGSSYESSGNAKGLNLEWGLKPKTKYKPYVPIEARHIMEEEFRLAIPEIIEDLSNAASKAIADEIALKLTINIYV